MLISPNPQNDCDPAVLGVHPRFMVLAPKVDLSAPKLHPPIAAGLARLVQLKLRVLENTEFEERIALTTKHADRLVSAGARGSLGPNR